MLLLFYKSPDLGNKIFKTRNVRKSEAYLTCINFSKFQVDLKSYLEVIRLPGWHENEKFSVKMQFFTFLTPLKNLFSNQWQVLNLIFLKVDLEGFTFPKNQYSYLSFQTLVELQSFTKYLRVILVSMWNSILQENLTFIFQNFLADINKIFILAGILGTRLSFYGL